MSITAEELGAITVDAWQTLLGLDPRIAPPHTPTDDVVHCATVHITGDTQWTIRIDCSDAHVRDVAGAMFGTASDEATDEDISDALGEMANVVAGNAKALLDGSARLSLPTVARGRSFEVTLPGMAETDRLHFVCDDAELSVAIFEQAGTKSASPSVAAATA